MGDIPKKIGKYDLLYEIDSGGMGTVFRGRDEDLDRMVAIKMLSKKLFANIDHQLRFIQEAKIIAKLDDPGIIKVYGIEYVESNAFLIMEYLEGKTLLELLDEKGKLTPFEAVPILKQLAGALAHAHSRGVVHLDIKPDNVMVLKDGSIKLMDFGISLDYESELDIPASHKEQMGTPKYMSPEQFINAEVDFRSDIYSFGILAYEILTGFAPFKAKKREEYMKKHLHEKAPPLQNYSKDVSKKLAKYINKALSKTKESRPQSLETFLSSSSFLKSDIEQELVIIWVTAGAFLFFIFIGTYIVITKRHEINTKFFFQKNASITNTIIPQEIIPLADTPPEKLENKSPQLKLPEKKPVKTIESKKIEKPIYQLIDADKLYDFSKSTPFPQLIFSISKKNKNYYEKRNAVITMLWQSEGDLEKLIPFLKFNDPVLVKNIAYILGVRNITSSLFSMAERIENERDESLLEELYKSLGYFDHPLAVKILNKGFLETGSLKILNASMHGLYERALPQSIEKAKLLLLIDDEKLKAEIYYFLATNGDLRGVEWARKKVQNSSKQVKIYSLNTLSLSTNTQDLAFLTPLKREMYQSIELMNAYKKCMITLKTRDLKGIVKYAQIEQECEKNKNLLAWAAYQISKEKSSTGKNWLKKFLKKYPLKNYRDYIRAYFQIHS